MAEGAEIFPIMRSAHRQRNDVIHIGGRGATVPAQWFLSQNQNPKPSPGGPVSALVGGGPDVRAPWLNPFRGTGWSVLGDSFSHDQILISDVLAGNRNQGVEGDPPGRAPARQARRGSPSRPCPVFYSQQSVPYKTRARAFCFCISI